MKKCGTKIVVIFFLVQAILCHHIYAIISQSTHSKINKIEEIIHQDPMNRGLTHLFKCNDVTEAVQLLLPAQHIAIITGFFIPNADAPETDGPLGAFAIAHALVALGKKVTLVSDKWCMPALNACNEIFKHPNLSIIIFPENKNEQLSCISQVLSRTIEYPIDCLISIERLGPAQDGSYRNMRGIDISDVTAPLDTIFTYVEHHPELKIATIGIGDGGNEIGMGNILAEVETHIPLGSIIGCVTPVNQLIITGVSNWGGYALAAALGCCEQKQFDSISIAEIFPSNKEQFLMLNNMINFGCVDGVSLKNELAIDGMAWDKHAVLLDEIRNVMIGNS